MRQLATHTAGYAFKQLEAWPNTSEELPDFEKRIYAPREMKQPVVEMDYWTNGYFVIMQLIEHVVGQDIESIAQKRLFKPLGMTRTTFLGTKAEKMGRVMPYAAQQQRRLTELATAPPLERQDYGPTLQTSCALAELSCKTNILTPMPFH